MATIRERFASALLGPEKTRLEQTTRLLLHAYESGPWEMTPEDLVTQLREVDSSLLADLVNSVAYDLIGGFGSGSSTDTERERVRAVDESRRLYKRDVLTQWIVWTWTNFGFGETITIKLEDEKAQDDWNEFWDADRNAAILDDDQLAFMSEDILVDGEKYFAFIGSTFDGTSTIREIDTKEIAEYIKHPDDGKQILYYKRVYSTASISSKEVYYPDWAAVMSGVLDDEYKDGTGKTMTVKEAVLPKNAVTADQLNDKSVVLILHSAHNRKGGDHGWPLMTAGAPWSRAHKKFREDRASVAASVAMYVNKIKVKGGSRAIDSVRAKIQSALSSSNLTETNPAAAAGSTWLENDAADMQRLNMGTGAGDAKSDGEGLLLMAGLGGGIYPHWMGAGDAYRLATASSMEAPVYREFSRYQKFWGAQFKKMVRIVLWMLETYGHKKYTSYEAKVSTDKLLQNDLGAQVSAITTAIGNLLVPFKDALPPETVSKLLATAWLAILQTMGVANADELASVEAFKLAAPAAPPEPPATEPATTPDDSTPGSEPEAMPDAGQLDGGKDKAVQELLDRIAETRELVREAMNGIE